MNGPSYGWPSGRGRGRGQGQYLDFWEECPGRNPATNYVRRDPVSNNFKLHVRSIPSNWDVTILQNVFSKCGEPKNVYLHSTKGSNGLTWGFVEYEHFPEASNAVRELNDNVLLNIQVSFAREKLPEENVDVLPFILNESLDGTGNHRSSEALVDPRTLIKTVKNDSPLSSEIPVEEFHKPLLDAESQKCLEENLFQRILNLYREGKDLTSKCNICEANCSMACSGCTSVFYCSENCQNRDWASHSAKCKGASPGAGRDVSYSRGGGDNRQARSEFTNGYGSERENRSDSRTNRFASDKRNNRDDDRGFNRERSNRGGQNGSYQTGKRSILEERRARLELASRQNENDKGFRSRFGQNSQRPQSSQESRNTCNSRQTNAEKEDEDWGSTNEEIQDKQEKAVEPAPVLEAVKVNTAGEGQLVEPELVLQVVIIFIEDRGLFWVQQEDQKNQVATLVRQLEEYYKTCSQQFIPVHDGVCGIEYEKAWYRCKVTSLDPLTVLYIDFGYPEAVEPSRLFELSAELKSLPPFAFKIKLVDGTSASFMDKGDGDSLVVKLIKKVDNFWVAEVVGDNIAVPDDSETVKTNNQLPVAVTSEPTPVDQAIPANTVPAVTVPKQEPLQQPPATPEPVAQQPFPSMLDSTNFTTVMVTYGDKEQKDAYYVGPSTIWGTVAEMCQYFKSVIHNCEMITPKRGALGLTMFEDDWYRVKIVSLTPLLAYFMDYGNIEEIKPEQFKKCPETHVHIPQMVHKIKLAPGTGEKYFNLPDASQISVKPVSWLDGTTVVVEVEGEIYTKTTPVEGIEDPSSPPTITTQHPSSSSTSPSVANNAAPGSSPSPSAATSDVQLDSTCQVASSVGQIPVQVDLSPRRPLSAVDFLQEKWQVMFIPNKVDVVNNSLFGQVCCQNIPTTLSFVKDNEEFQSYLSSKQYDANFRPSIGEIVGFLAPSGEWERGRVLPQPGLVALNDQCGVTRSSQLFKLHESYVNIPSMAAVFTLDKEDLALLNRLVDKEDIIFDVVQVIKDKSKTSVRVVNNALEELQGILNTWDYEPLETPDPLAPGVSVTISKVVDSNTLLVTLSDDLDFQQQIQIECRKTSEEFTKSPKEGDYVAFLHKESDGYYRCRIKEVKGDAYTIYCVDDSTFYQAKINDLRPLPESIRNIPCRMTQIELKDVDKVTQTEQAQLYISHIVAEDKFLTIGTLDSADKATLTVEGEEDTLNNKLKELLIPKVVPDLDGKFTIMSLPELQIPLNKEMKFVVCQSEPLYVQLVDQYLEYLSKFHGTIQDHCDNDNAPYNPCVSELCLAKFEGEWYRCRCLKETNTGDSVLMLVDFGNIFNVRTSDIRRVPAEMLTTPSMAVPCIIHDLPDPVSPALKTRLNEILLVESSHDGVFVAENDGSYEVVIESVKQAIQELK